MRLTQAACIFCGVTAVAACDGTRESLFTFGSASSTNQTDAAVEVLPTNVVAPTGNAGVDGPQIAMVLDSGHTGDIVIKDSGVTPVDECSSGGVLRRRPEGEMVRAIDGMFGGSPDPWQLPHRGQSITLSGQGYLNLRWSIEYRTRAGLIIPPGFLIESGLFLRVGGGGGKNMGDPEPGTSGTFMGNAEEGISYMPDGVPTPWQNEFYYLDGQVTINQNEDDGLYNLAVSPETYETTTSEQWGIYDPGVVCDLE